jgi:hypothetical protein
MEEGGAGSGMDLDAEPSLHEREREFVAGEVHPEPMRNEGTDLHARVGEHLLDEQQIRLSDLVRDRDRGFTDLGDRRRGPPIANGSQKREVDSARSMDGLDDAGDPLDAFGSVRALDEGEDKAIVDVGRVRAPDQDIDGKIAKLVSVFACEDRDGFVADLLVGKLAELRCVPPRTAGGARRPERPDEPGRPGRGREPEMDSREQRLGGALLDRVRRARVFERGARGGEKIDGGDVAPTAPTGR